MSTIQRHKNTIYGLNADLLALQNTNAAEATARANAVTALQASIADAVTAAAAATTAEAATRAAADAALQTAITQEATDRDAAIASAKLALGTNFTVADIAGRDALTGLTVSDRVLVTDDGDGKWALYQTSVVTTGAGATSTFVKLSDQDALTNAISATSIKAAYESNSDTNAFTNAEKAKVGFVSATVAIDLDKVTQNDALLTSTTLAGASDTSIASALAIKTYVDEATRTGGSAFATESLTVAADKITLSHPPKDGVVLNFSTVRNIDGNGIAYDIPVIQDGTDALGLTFMLAPDAPGQFDGLAVLVQYPYLFTASIDY